MENFYPFGTSVDYWARDAEMTSTMSNHDCLLNIFSQPYGTAYLYDPKSNQIKIHHQDLCSLYKNRIGNYFEHLSPVSVDSSPIQYDEAKRLLEDIEMVHGRHYQAIFNYADDSADIAFDYCGQLDSNGLFHGPAQLSLWPTKNCYKGLCTKSDIGTIRGTFHHGQLEGM